jgi:hypothetical protein
MSDFDVTDNYELEWSDDVTAALDLRDGTTLTVNLGALPEWKVAARFSVTDPDGVMTHDYLQIYDDDAQARAAMAYYARQIINEREPLGENVNWDNDELVMLLEDQQRIVLCPLCFGHRDQPCAACGGCSYVRMEDFALWIDVTDDHDEDEQ